jgi:hypothetical protein
VGEDGVARDTERRDVLTVERLRDEGRTEQRVRRRGGVVALGEPHAVAPDELHPFGANLFRDGLGAIEVIARIRGRLDARAEIGTRGVTAEAIGERPPFAVHELRHALLRDVEPIGDRGLRRALGAPRGEEHGHREDDCDDAGRGGKDSRRESHASRH